MNVNIKNNLILFLYKNCNKTVFLKKKIALAAEF